MAQKTSVTDYNYYDRGYTTGAQTSIFVGPIWVEEALSINIGTTSNDVPVYPYSSEYYNRLLLGRYIVTGTFAIPYVKPNYLLGIIDEANKTQLSQAELKDMITERTNIFSQTVAAKIEAQYNNASETSKADAAAYVKRVARELELVTSGFDLTIIQGDVYGQTSGIEIYKNVKIVSIQKGYLNDDETLVELYTFTAQRMPDRKKDIEKEKHPNERYVIKADVIKAVKEITKDLIREVFVYPEMKVKSPTNRSSKVFTTDKLGITGLLGESTRCYGKSVVINELAYCYKFPRLFNLLNPKTNQADDDTTTSTTKTSRVTARKKRYSLPIWKLSDVKGAIPVADGTAEPDVSSINNTSGGIVSLDRSISAKYIGAVSQIQPIPSTVKVKGGTILLKRTKNTNADVGSFMAPTFVKNDDFMYSESDLDGLRYGVMWNTLIGCRSSGQPTTSYAADDKTLRTFGKPILSLAYYENTSIESITEDTWRMEVSAPVYLDYVDVNNSSDGSGKAAKPILCSDYASKKFSFEGNTSKNTIVLTKPDGSSFDLNDKSSKANSDGSNIAVFYDRILLGELLTSIDIKNDDTIWNLISSWNIKEIMRIIYDRVNDKLRQYLAKFHYKFFEIKIPLNGLAGIDFNKSLNIQPYVFVRPGTDDDIVFPEDLKSSSDIQKVMLALSQKCKQNGGEDDGCKIDFHYDWYITSVDSTMDAQSVTISGLYYAHKKDQTVDKEMLADIVFVATVLPMTDLQDKTNADDQDSPKLITDTKENGGQYTELYSLVRCDIPSYFSVPFFHTAQESAIDVLKGSWIPLTPWSHTGVWGYMESTSEIESQYEIYKKIMAKMLESKAAVLPDVAVNSDPFDVQKDIACLQMVIPNSLSPIAGFMRGYGFAVSPKGILDAISQITFTGPNLSTVNVFTNQASDNKYSLGAVIDYCQLRSKALEEIRTTILDEIEIAGYKISEDPLTDLSNTSSELDVPIYIEAELVTPAPNVVKYGFTADGYKDLKNENSETTSTEFQLKGYSI